MRIYWHEIKDVSIIAYKPTNIAQIQHMHIMMWSLVCSGNFSIDCQWQCSLVYNHQKI